MTDAAIRIRYGPLPRALMAQRGDPTQMGSEAARAAVRAAGPFVQRALTFNTPSGATGKARQSVFFEEGFRPGHGFVGYGAPASTYIRFANDGTKPHKAPFGPVALWAMRKGLEPGAVWRSIMRRGTRAQHFVEKTVEQVRGPAKAMMISAASAAMKRAR